MRTAKDLKVGGCFTCEHASAAYYELEERMAVDCGALKKDVPEVFRDCPEYSLSPVLSFLQGPASMRAAIREP